MISELHNIISNIPFESIEKHPNILVAARFWDDRRYQAAKVCYRFMRMIDDHIDNRKAGEEAITCMEMQLMTEKVNGWIECLYKSEDNDPLIMELTGTLATFKIPRQFFHNFTKSMLYDINNTGFSTLAEFLEYSEGASVAPASVFVHLCCLSEDSGGYATPDFDVIEVARPCALFSYLVHIIRDFQEDQLNNLNYFALDVLDKYHIKSSDLKDIARGAPVTNAFREVIREYYLLAQDYGEQTREVLEKLSSKVEGRYLLSLHVIYELYRMVFDRIDIEKGQFTGRELNPTPQELRERVMHVIQTREYESQ